jgi:glyoxalase family protein
MRLEGLHHITMITGDAQATVAFQADLLGLRLVKKTVNFDAPDAYHLYFGDEQGSPGSILTWFEFAGARPGTAGAGMVHTLQLGVAAEAALGFWTARLAAAGVATERTADGLAFRDHDGLRFELVVDPDGPDLRAKHPEVPAEHAIRGMRGARAYASRPFGADHALLVDTLGFTPTDTPGAYLVEGGGQRFRWAYDASPGHGAPGAGTVHHIAWHARDEDHVAWQQRAGAAGMQVTPVIDRDYFDAIYFRQPQGILFEIATTSPGFAVDEDPAHLGEGLRLPKQHEHLRPQLEQLLTPVADPRTARQEA